MILRKRSVANIGELSYDLNYDLAVVRIESSSEFLGASGELVTKIVLLVA